MNIDVHLSRIVDQASVDIELTGQSMGASIRGAGTILVAAVDARSTDLQIKADFRASGLLNQVEDSKIKAVTKEFIDAYLSNVETGLMN